jgi:hypothetical protein
VYEPPGSFWQHAPEAMRAESAARNEFLRSVIETHGAYVSGRSVRRNSQPALRGRDVGDVKVASGQLGIACEHGREQTLEALGDLPVELALGARGALKHRDAQHGSHLARPARPAWPAEQADAHFGRTVRTASASRR